MTSPSGRELVGTWASSDAHLTALLAGADLHAGCTTFIIDDPILLDDRGHFSAQARVDPSTAILGHLPVVRLAGSLAEGRVTIVVPKSSWTVATTYVLDAGGAPALQDAPMCPL